MKPWAFSIETLLWIWWKSHANPLQKRRTNLLRQPKCPKKQVKKNTNSSTSSISSAQIPLFQKKKQIHGAMPPPAPWLEQETPPVLRLEGAWAYNACVQKNMGVFHGGSPIAGWFINVYNGKPHRKTRLAKFNQLEVSPINWGLSFQTYIKSPTPTGWNWGFQWGSCSCYFSKCTNKKQAWGCGLIWRRCLYMCHQTLETQHTWAYNHCIMLFPCCWLVLLVWPWGLLSFRYWWRYTIAIKIACKWMLNTLRGDMSWPFPA